MSNEELKEGFEVEELDDADLDEVAGGLADPNNCDCTINNCEA